jgi:Fic family protein
VKLNAVQITPELLSVIAEIERFKGRWQTLNTLAPQRLEILKKVATVESIGSSTRIEGSKLTDRQVEELLAQVTITTFVSRDAQEVLGYAEVMELIFDSHQAIRISEDYIKQLHSVMLRHSTKDERHRGDYKKLPNHVEAFDGQGKSLGIIFETATPFETPFQMQELVEALRKAMADAIFHPLLLVGAFIVHFLKIHPFQDGNGRLSRVLTTLLLLKYGYSYVIYSSLESVIEENKEGYYLALRKTQMTLDRETPDYAPWMRFFLRMLKAQIDKLEAKISREPALEGLPPDALKILEYVRAEKRITTGIAAVVTAAPRATVKSRLAELVKRGLLQPHGKGRGTWYGLPFQESTKKE